MSSVIRDDEIDHPIFGPTGASGNARQSEQLLCLPLALAGVDRRSGGHAEPPEDVDPDDRRRGRTLHWALRQCVIKLDHRRLPKACAPDRSVADNAVAENAPYSPVAQAHPDVETLTTVVAIAYYVARCAGRTRRHLHIGEESEVIGERYAQSAVVAAERLGGDHVSELTSRSEVARAVSVGRAGGGIRKWRDR